MKAARPWQSHKVVTRIDGYIADHGDRIPDAIAKLIARAKPQAGDNTIAAIRARMLARHRKVLGHV
jgi:hypothetical protein